MDWLRRSVGAFPAAWAGFPVSTRVLTGVLLVLFAFVAVWGVTSASQGGWKRIVDSGDKVGDRGAIVSKLKEIGVDTRVEGESISVPTEHADKAMLQLHGSGVLADDTFFRFLKETDFFGTADKSSKQWIVAQQQRLAAIIQGLDYVRTAQVQLAQTADPKSIWWADGRESTAAVVIGLELGESMTSSRVRGLAALVSGAIPNLKPSGVKIVDQAGQFFRADETETGVTDELSYASMIETKVARILPDQSRVSAQVRLKVEKWETKKGSETESDKRSGSGATVESIHVSAVVPDDAPDVPAGHAARQSYLEMLKVAVRAAAGAREKDPISIRIAPLSITRVVGVDPVAPTTLAVPGWHERGSTLFLFALGFGALFIVYRLLRGLAPVSDAGVVAEESLRAPGESILSAQDDVLDRIRDGVRETVARNPREAADVARRWMSP